MAETAPKNDKSMNDSKTRQKDVRSSNIVAAKGLHPLIEPILYCF